MRTEKTGRSKSISSPAPLTRWSNDEIPTPPFNAPRLHASGSDDRCWHFLHGDILDPRARFTLPRASPLAATDASRREHGCRRTFADEQAGRRPDPRRDHSTFPAHVSRLHVRRDDYGGIDEWLFP